MEDIEYQEFELTQAKFVSGKGEICFKEVLEDFKDAKYINVLTYNISSNNDVLINSLKEAGERGIPINVITNIPNRWESYFADNWKTKAKRTIDVYLNKLEPKKLGKLASVLFKFDNHGKIVMTDNVIYWGSANYSDESKKNYECGTISRDKDLINFVNNTILPAIIEKSTNYYQRDYVSYIASIYSAMAYLHNVYEEIHDASYGIWDDYDTNFKAVEYFNFQNNYISWDMLEGLIDTIIEFEDLLDGLLEVENEEEGDWSQYEELEELVDNYKEIFGNKNSIINSLCFNLEEMARYDEDYYTNNLLTGEYGSEAYDDALEYYAQLASERGIARREELIEGSKDSIVELLKNLENYEIRLRDFADELVKLSHINGTIDNTE